MKNVLGERERMMTYPIELFYYSTRGTWIWMRGIETFYDDDNYLVGFDCRGDAVAWAVKEHPDWDIDLNDLVG